MPEPEYVQMVGPGGCQNVPADQVKAREGAGWVTHEDYKAGKGRKAEKAPEPKPAAKPAPLSSEKAPSGP